jgi:hypothetical protein
MEKASGSQERTIVIYSPRRRLIVSIFLCLLIIAGFLFLLRFISSDLPTERTFSPLSSLLVVLGLTAILLLLVGLALFAGAAIFNVRRFISHEPALTIDTQGITIRDYVPLGRIWLPWANVAALYGRSPSYSYLYVRVKNLDQLLISYHPVQRFIFRLSNRSALITIPRAFLALPVPQILTQVRDRFGSDLQLYQVAIQSMG